MNANMGRWYNTAYVDKRVLDLGDWIRFVRTKPITEWQSQQLVEIEKQIEREQAIGSLNGDGMNFDSYRALYERVMLIHDAQVEAAQ